MKKSILIAAILVVTGFSSLFANDAGKAVKESFNQTFAKAEDVKWTVEKGLNVASFKFNGEMMQAYYMDDATLVTTIHHLLSDRLPIFLQASLKENYAGYWITDLIESANKDISHYHVTIENGSKTMVLKSVDGTEWTVEQVQNKD